MTAGSGAPTSPIPAGAGRGKDVARDGVDSTDGGRKTVTLPCALNACATVRIRLRPVGVVLQRLSDQRAEETAGRQEAYAVLHEIPGPLQTDLIDPRDRQPIAEVDERRL